MSDPAHRGPTDRQHDGPAPPQRGLLRRPAGHRGRRARRASTRAGRSSRRCWPSSGSASPATRAASGCCRPPRRRSATSGSTCRRELREPLGPNAGARPAGPAAGLPRRRRCRAAGRVRPQDAAAYRIAVTRLDQDSAEVLTEIAALRVTRTQAERLPARRRTTTAAIRSAATSRRAASTCSGSCCPARCWRGHDAT